MANLNSIPDLSNTASSNINYKGQSIRGTALASTIDSMFQNNASMLADFYDSLGGVATVSGTNTLTVTITEDWAALASGLFLAIKVANTNTGAVTLNPTVPTAGALGAKAIRLQGDSALTGGEMVANGVYLLRYSSTYNTTGAWILLNPTNGGSSGREKLTADRTYYVRTDGSDSNTGLANTAGSAFLTIQKAVDVLTALDTSIYNVTVQVGAGTYTGSTTFSGPWGGKGTVTILGDSGTPGNVIISTSSYCFGVTGTLPASLTINGFKLTSSANSCLINNGVGILNFLNIEFGSASIRHLSCGSVGAKIVATGNYSISGGAAAHAFAGLGYVQTNTRTVTLLASVSITVFAQATQGGGLLANGMTFTLGAFSVTGQRYNVSTNAWIETSGGGASYFPGNSAGATATGGQYN